MLLELGPRRFDVTRQAVVVGIIPSPFAVHDGGLSHARDRLLTQAARHVDQGADALEIDLRSVGAGSDDAAPSIDDVASFVESVRTRFDVPLVAATSKAPVLRAALAAGAVAANDRGGPVDPDYLPAVVDSGASLVLTYHRLAPPRPTVAEIAATMSEAAARAESAGVSRSRIVVDPGADIGLPEAQVAEVVRASERFAESGYHLALSVPCEAGSADPRELGAVVVALGLIGGCRVIRTHDVRSARRTCTVVAALLHAGSVAR